MSNNTFARGTVSLTVAWQLTSSLEQLFSCSIFYIIIFIINTYYFCYSLAGRAVLGNTAPGLEYSLRLQACWALALLETNKGWYINNFLFHWNSCFIETVTKGWPARLTLPPLQAQIKSNINLAGNDLFTIFNSFYSLFFILTPIIFIYPYLRVDSADLGWVAR